MQVECYFIVHIHTVNCNNIIKTRCSAPPPLPSSASFISTNPNFFPLLVRFFVRVMPNARPQGLCTSLMIRSTVKCCRCDSITMVSIKIFVLFWVTRRKKIWKRMDRKDREKQIKRANTLRIILLIVRRVSMFAPSIGAIAIANWRMPFSILD